MNTGQMLLVIGALALLSTLTLAVNSTIINKYQMIYEAEATIDAISLGQALLDEALAKAFDEKTTGTSKVYNVSNLTPIGSLGADAGEAIAGFDSTFLSVLRFDDFDDFHNYNRIATTPRMGRFVVTSRVIYVTSANPDLAAGSQTYQKKMVVTVSHPSLKVPVPVSDVAIYRMYY